MQVFAKSGMWCQKVEFNMFHVFTLVYLTTGFYGLPYYFSPVLQATSASVYTVPLRMYGASTFAF